MQIFAGLCLNCAVFGALLRPLELVAVKMPPTVATEVGADAYMTSVWDSRNLCR